MAHPDRYKWIALVNTTLGVLMVTIDGSIVLIAMPDIFRGIGLDPLLPSNSFYLLWMILGYLVVTSVLVVSLGRLGDMYGRVRMYNLGFVVFTFFSLLLTVCWLHGQGGAIYLIIGRIFQGVGGAMLFANSAAILTDAFPIHQRGMAMGINGVAGTAGTFIGLVVGGLLAPINWRLIFLVSVPVGLFCTIWAFVMLRDISPPHRTSVDWAGNVTFAAGLITIMVAITYGIEPYRGHTMGWTSPTVVTELAVGVVLLIAFAFIEKRSPEPMFRLPLFRIRAFTAGTLASFLAAVGRGGLMFMMIIWLQGIWLPLHGYEFSRTPLWAGIYLLPLTLGFFIAGPVSGMLSDRYGARPFATAGMIAAATAFLLLELLPVNFSYLVFAPLLLIMGLSNGLFMSPNRAAVMNSLPAEHRGAGSGMMSDIPEFGPGALDRHFLLADDRGPGIVAAEQSLPRTRGARRLSGGRHARVTSASGRNPVRGIPRVQPDAASSRPVGAVASSRRQCRHTARTVLLPAPDFCAVPAGTPYCVRLRHRGLSDRRGCLVVQGTPLCPPRDDDPRRGRIASHRPGHRSRDPSVGTGHQVAFRSGPGPLAGRSYPAL